MESLSGIHCALSRIHSDKFDFRDMAACPELESDLRSFGLLQPLIVFSNGKSIELIDGHRRLRILKKLKKKTAPVFQIPIKDSRKLFLCALLLNRLSGYSDWEKCGILKRASTLFSEKELLNQVLPLIHLPSSPKILEQYRQAARLPVSVQQQIRKGEWPFQGSFWLMKLRKPDLDYFSHTILKKIRPTASQSSHFGEWLLDLTQAQKKPLEKILKGAGIKIPSLKDPRARTDAFYQLIRDLRFPRLAEKEKNFQRALKELEGVSRIRIKAPDYFEEEGFYVQAHIPHSRALKEVVEQLQHVQNQAAAWFDTLL